MTEVLLLRSDRFSFDPPVVNGVRADLPLGDDLAAHLKQGLTRQASNWTFHDPVREDFGSVLPAYLGDKVFHVTITWYPLGDSPRRYEDVWFLQFSQSHGCVTLLMRPRNDVASLTELRRLVDEAVRGDPEVFRSATWLTSAEFDEMQGVRRRSK